MTRIAAILGSLLAIRAAAWAQPASPPAERTHDIEIEDYFSIALIDVCASSSKGGPVAYVERRWEPKDDSRNADLWLAYPPPAPPRRLTFDACNDGSPKWSRDGRTLYFLSSPKRAGESEPYDGKQQVFALNVAAECAEPQPITRVRGGIGHYDLAEHSAALFYTTEDDASDDEWRELRDKFKDKVQLAAGTRKVSVVHRLDLLNWRVEKFVEPGRYITALDVSPDASRIAMLTCPDDRLITNEGKSRVDVYDTAAKKIATLPDKLWRADAPSPNGWLENLAWSSDSMCLAFSVGFDGYPSEAFVAVFGAAGPVVRRLPRPEDVYVAGGLAFRPGTHDLCYLGDHHARQRVYCQPASDRDDPPPAICLTPGDVVVEAFSFDDVGAELSAVVSGPGAAPDVHVFSIAAGGVAPTISQFTRVNPQIDRWRIPLLSVVSWKAPDGATVEGVLELPHDHAPGSKPLPLVVDIHGGPTWSSKYRFEFNSYGRTMYPAKGYALLSPNYRGSTGFGDKFLVDLIGRENDIEVRDILAGVDAMIERGIADPQKLAVIGWSNGGFLTNCLITRDPRFKAASSGAGMIDQVIQWGTQDTPGHNFNYMRGLPWNAPDAYRAASPLYGLGNVRTPTIIHCGENDERVPLAHSRTLFRALHDYLEVPTQLVVYPGAGHGLTKYSHRKAHMEWDLAWFDRYVYGERPAR